MAAASISLLCRKQTKSSATAEKQRVSCPHGGGLGPAAPFPPLTTPMHIVESETRNKRIRQACRRVSAL